MGRIGAGALFRLGVDCDGGSVFDFLDELMEC